MTSHRRTDSLAYVVTAAVLLVACATVKPRANPTSVHAGSYWFFVDNVTRDEKSTEPPAVLLWVALPITRPGQAAQISKISPEPTEILEDASGGNRVAFWRVDNPESGKPLIFRYDFEIHNQAIELNIDPAKVTRAAPDSPEYRRYTVSEPWLEISPAIAARAREIVGAETNPYRQAQLVFDWIVDNVTYSYPDIAGRGVTKAFDGKTGDCGEFSHIFVTMMRSLGIPTRDVTADWYQEAGHAWAEIFLPPYGWVPVDTSGAQLIKNGLKGQMSEKQVAAFMETRGIPTRDPRWLFGHLYPNRIEVFVGENVALEGKTPGASRTFQFMQPGGQAAWPPGVQLPGLSRKTVSGGFFTFGDDSRNEAAARTKAEEELAPAWLAAGDNDRALAGLSKALERKPEDATKLLMLCQAHFNLKHWDPAIDACRRSIAGKGGSIKPSAIDPWDHMFIGMSLDAKGQRNEALKEYQTAKDSGSNYGGVQTVAKHFLDTPYAPGK